MSGTQHVALRPSPPHMRKTGGPKNTRSAPSSRVLATGPKITIKGAIKAKQSKDKEEVFDFEDDSDTMAMSFLQYCAMCEKQIVVPNTSILYCSESCRRRDAGPPEIPPLVRLAQTSWRKNDRVFLPDCLSNSLPDPLPRLKPTPRNGFADARIPPKFHEGNSDLDPTEWKPSERAPLDDDDPGNEKSKSLYLSTNVSPSGSATSLAGSWKPKLPHRPSSEAFAYLSQFHRSSDSLSSSSHKRRATRATTTNSNSFAAARTTPSLSHSPTISSNGSGESLTGTPYDFEMITRPSVISLPSTTISATTASVSAAASGTAVIGNGMGIDEEGATEGGMTIGEKKTVLPSPTTPTAGGDKDLKSAHGSLKKLLAGAGAAKKM